MPIDSFQYSSTICPVLRTKHRVPVAPQQHHKYHAPPAGTKLHMADISLPRQSMSLFRSDDGYLPTGSKFSLRSLFHDYYSPRASTAVSSVVSPSTVFWSADGFASFDEFREHDEERTRESVLAYLPAGGIYLPPKTRDLLIRATSQYVNRGKVDDCSSVRPMDLPEDVLNTIEEEYISVTVPFSVGSIQCDADKSDRTVDSVAACKILSFAALHRIPREITLLLFGVDNNLPLDLSVGKLDADVNDSVPVKVPKKAGGAYTLDDYKMAFSSGGWDAVSFPRGLALRLRRRFVQSRMERLSPFPRKVRLRHDKAANDASIAVLEASLARAPARRITREEFLASIDDEIRTISLDREDWSLKDAMLFFPTRRNQFLKRLARAIRSQSAKLQKAGRAGVVAYGALNFVWYTLAITFQWRRIASLSGVPPGTLVAVKGSIQKFGKVLAAAYIGSQLTKLPRLSLAVILAPVGNRALLFVKQKLRVSENSAFLIVTGVLLGSCVGVGAAVIFMDAIVSSAGTFSM